MPWEIDEAVLRRLTKRIYVPLPDAEAREALIRHLMVKHQGKDAARMLEDRKAMARIVLMTQGYSGSDLTAVHTYICIYLTFTYS
jgi:SpoVK/Ycf46/Vps4 family AAA+-type ATPase